jgi:export-related chaperone CsaA
LASGSPEGWLSISIDEFTKAEIRIGRIAIVEDIPAARNPMYRLMVVFGETSKQCVAGIKNHYQKEELVDKLVVAVVNLQPKSVAGVMSECMLLAAYDSEKLSLLVPDKDLPTGTKVG